jgi:hypothetical protein
VRAGVDPYDASASAPHELVSFTNSFHGRTMGALALTYKARGTCAARCRACKILGGACSRLGAAAAAELYQG